MEELETLKKQAYDAAKEILEIGKCKAGDLFVVGCSTSEVLGDKIGTASSPETARQYLPESTRQSRKSRFIWQPSAVSI